MSEIGRYFTHEAVRLGLSGLAAGCVAGLTWRAVGRVRWAAAPFVAAVFVAARYSDRSDWPPWDAMVGAGVFITLLAGLGSARLLAHPGVGWEWVVAGSLVSAAGVYAGVPETGPVLLAGGGLTGLAATAVMTRAHWAPAAGVGVAAVLGWAAMSGAAGRPWATVGGALCTGLAPWFAVRPLPAASSPNWSMGVRLLGTHVALVVLASRWIGVTPHAGWGRVAIVAVAGLAVAVATRRGA